MLSSFTLEIVFKENNIFVMILFSYQYALSNLNIYIFKMCVFMFFITYNFKILKDICHQSLTCKVTTLRLLKTSPYDYR